MVSIISLLQISSHLTAQCNLLSLSQRLQKRSRRDRSRFRQDRCSEGNPRLSITSSIVLDHASIVTAVSFGMILIFETIIVAMLTVLAMLLVVPFAMHAWNSPSRPTHRRTSSNSRWRTRSNRRMGRKVIRSYHSTRDMEGRGSRLATNHISVKGKHGNHRLSGRSIRFLLIKFLYRALVNRTG